MSRRSDSNRRPPRPSRWMRCCWSRIPATFSPRPSPVATCRPARRPRSPTNGHSWTSTPVTSFRTGCAASMSSHGCAAPRPANPRHRPHLPAVHVAGDELELTPPGSGLCTGCTAALRGRRPVREGGAFAGHHRWPTARRHLGNTSTHGSARCPVVPRTLARDHRDGAEAHQDKPGALSAPCGRYPTAVTVSAACSPSPGSVSVSPVTIRSTALSRYPHACRVVR